MLDCLAGPEDAGFIISCLPLTKRIITTNSKQNYWQTLSLRSIDRCIPCSMF